MCIRDRSKANTQYTNIVETLEGAMVVGDETSYFSEGKVLIAAANPDMMEYYISRGDLVILGNRYESQLCAIEMDAACIDVYKRQDYGSLPETWKSNRLFQFLTGFVKK